MGVKEDQESVLTEIGIRLAKLRIEKGFDSSKSFAEAYDLPSRQYCQLENGMLNSTFKSLIRVLKIHQVSLDDFICINERNQCAQ